MISISKPIIQKEEKRAVIKVLNSGMLAQGEQVEEFEKKFANFTGTRYAVATSSGTTALHLALLAHGLKREDEVITTPFSFIASANACLFVEAIPVFTDIQADTFNLDPFLIERKITNRTKAILIVHLFGNPSQMDKIMPVVKKYNLILIEDCCQAHGAEFRGKKVGSFGTGCFSFYATKNMTTGEGGMITTNKRSIAEKVRLLRNHGLNIPSYSKLPGYNFRMTDIQAAIGVEQLAKLEQFNQQRIKNAQYLTSKLKNMAGVVAPRIYPKTKHVFHQYTIRITKRFLITRNKLVDVLKKEGVETKVFYPLPIYKQESYQNLGYQDRLLVVEKIVKEVISLPIHPLVKKHELDLIAKIIRRCSVK